jgi:hypothetical protein
VRPGPLLYLQEQPRLFALIDELARETGQKEPDDVYLIHDVNAWVTQRGGFPGFGGRRVMGIGLPVLQFLTVSELRAVLAHEFGHFHGGDTSLGVFIYQTRAAIERTIQGLASADARLASLQGPFVAYGKFFLRTTEEISRAQESAADVLAAGIAGPRPLIEALKKLRVNAMAFRPYLNTEFSPVVGMGLLPPIGEGFQRFMERRTSAARSTSAWATSSSSRRRSWPSAIPTRTSTTRTRRCPSASPRSRRSACPDQANDDRLALVLLDDVPALDAELTRSIVVAEGRRAEQALGLGGRRRRLTWRTTRRAWAPYAKCFEPTPAEALAADFARIEAAILDWQAKNVLAGWDAEPDARASHAHWLVGSALTVAATGRGFTAFTLPGRPLFVRGPRGEIQPFEVIDRIARGELADAEWRAESLVSGSTAHPGDCRG